MFQINMKLIYLLLVVGLQVIQSAPVDESSTAVPAVTTTVSKQPTTITTTTTESPTAATTATDLVPPCDKSTDVYDNSQNGTDNYRLKIKGFTFVLAPSDALLGAAMMLGTLGDDALIPPARSNNELQAPAQRTLETHSKFSKLMHMLKKMNQ